MRKVFIILAVVFLAHSAWAQKNPVPVKERFRLFRDAAKQKLDKLDTVKLPSVDSLRIKSKVDSSYKLTQSKYNFQLKTDSLKTDLPSVDSLNNKLQLPSISADTLKGLNSLTDKVKISTDTVQQITQKVNEKFSEGSTTVQSFIKSKTDSLKVSDRLNGFQQKPPNQPQLKLPQTDNPISGLPDGKQQIPTVGFPTTTQPQLPVSTGVNLPKINTGNGVNSELPNANIPKTDIQGGVKLPDVDATNPLQSVKEKIDLPTTDLPDITKPDSSMIDELKDKALQNEKLKKYSAPVDKISTEVDPYKKRLDSLTIEDAATIGVEELESHLSAIDEIKAIEDNVQKVKTSLTAQQELAMLQRYQDKKIIQAELVRKTKNIANDKIGTLSPKINEQQNKFKRARKAHSSVQSVKNIPKKPENEMKKLLFYERLQPGISLQPYTSNVFSIDLSPQISFRTTKYASVGVGGVYRVAFDRKYDHFISSQGLYGLRGFVNYRLVKGLFVYGEVERLTLRASSELSDKTTASAVYNLNVGLGKRYKVSPKIYGSILALYRFEFGNHIAGTSKFNLRMVFEYRLKRKPKAE